ncbi:MAG TPA: glycoside hydrolase family 16 protein [Acidimicrobiia bacterium]|nr:glycoside hydrolase family 16 protein [Acidimicrobiia bacterium]
MTLDERFEGDTLDETVWFPHYLPHWSSLEESAADHQVRDGSLQLRISKDHPLWCPDLHGEPLRVSCIQSGNVPGSQPFRDHLEIRAPDTAFRGYLPFCGDIGVRMRGDVTSRSMFAFWLSGVEDEAHQSGEICVAEIFGSGIDADTAEVGIGLHSFRDPALREDFHAERLRIDVSDFHEYGVVWRPGSLTFSIDGRLLRRIDQAPEYPVQLMLGVFDFPDRAGDPNHEPRMWVERVWSHPLE